MSKIDDLIEQAESCAAIGTNPQLGDVISAVCNDTRLCENCINHNVHDCQGGGVCDAVRLVIPYALYQEKCVIAPRALLQYALAYVAEIEVSDE